MIRKPLRLDYRSLGQILLAKQYVNFKESDCFVDIGPGGGGAFNVAKQVLTNPTCIAIELNSGADEAYGRMYGVKTFQSIGKFIESGCLAKICLLSHSLEHYKLNWLPPVLEELKGVLAPDGVIIIEVPLVDMRIHANYRFEDSPHFLFFSIESITLMLEKNGWSVLFVNSASESYEEWWAAKKNSIGIGQKPIPYLISKIRHLLRRSFSILPRFAQQKIRQAIGGQVIDFKHTQFSYGGNRTCLRVVAQPAKRK